MTIQAAIAPFMILWTLPLAIPLVLIVTVSIERKAMAAYPAAMLAFYITTGILSHKVAGRGGG